MTLDELLPLSIPGQAIVSRAPTSTTHKFYTFYCSAIQKLHHSANIAKQKFTIEKFKLDANKLGRLQ